MDKTPEYIKMCEKARKEIQEYYFMREEEDYSLHPSFLYSKRNDTISIDIWTPKLLKEILGNTKNGLVVNTEYDNDKMVDLPETDKQAIDSQIWLPRQDQLQEMIDEKWTTVLTRFIREMTYSAGHSRYVFGSNYDRSMEQLWLIFVMKEKFNKVWNGEDWVSA